MMWWTYERYRCSKYIGFIVVKRAFINIYYYYIPTNKVQGYDGNVFYGLKLMKVNGIQFLPPSLVRKTAASVLIYLVCSVSLPIATVLTVTLGNGPGVPEVH